jgi:hypothetical protein
MAEQLIGDVDFKIQNKIVWSEETEASQEEYFDDLRAISVLFDESVINNSLTEDVKRYIGFDSFKVGYGSDDVKLAAAEWLVCQKTSFNRMDEELKGKTYPNNLPDKFFDKLKLSVQSASLKKRMQGIKDSTKWLFGKSAGSFEIYWNIDELASRGEQLLQVSRLNAVGEEKKIDLDIQKVHKAPHDLENLASLRRQDLRVAKQISSKK